MPTWTTLVCKQPEGAFTPASFSSAESHSSLFSLLVRLGRCECSERKPKAARAVCLWLQCDPTSINCFNSRAVFALLPGLLLEFFHMLIPTTVRAGQQEIHSKAHLSNVKALTQLVSQHFGPFYKLIIVGSSTDSDQSEQCGVKNLNSLLQTKWGGRCESSPSRTRDLWNVNTLSLTVESAITFFRVSPPQGWKWGWIKLRRDSAGAQTNTTCLWGWTIPLKALIKFVSSLRTFWRRVIK